MLISRMYLKYLNTILVVETNRIGGSVRKWPLLFRLFCKLCTMNKYLIITCILLIYFYLKNDALWYLLVEKNVSKVKKYK